MQQLTYLYTQWKGQAPHEVQKLPGAGSNRAYYRLSDDTGHSVVGVTGTSREENHAFVYLARHFFSLHLPVPQVLAVSTDEMRYLQTDLGSVSLFDAIREGRESGGHYSEAEQQLLLRTICELPRFQFTGSQGLDYSQCYPQPQFDEESVSFDLNYFKYCFLKATGIDFNEVSLESDFRMLKRDLTVTVGDGFMYRDFQARNVMLLNGSEPCFIDFQGGRLGPFYYDLASFLWQASAKYPTKLRSRLLDAYYDAAKAYRELPERDVFDNRLQLFVFFRILQVLGAYGFRGYFERKRHFLESIPAAIQNLHEVLQAGVASPYAYLESILLKLVSGYDATSVSHPQEERTTGQLVVRVFSFSYKKGIPADESGNGGGYVFDCRSTHNPGRYAPYKQLTGLDEPVIRFLEDDGEILTFLDSVYKLADAHVARYIERGFTSLMFSFGCTGGQHRSVYSAQHLAEHIHKKFGVEVHICHREQGISQVLEASTHG